MATSFIFTDITFKCSCNYTLCNYTLCSYTLLCRYVVCTFNLHPGSLLHILQWAILKVISQYLDILINEMRDRFGPMPKEIMRIIKIQNIYILDNSVPTCLWALLKKLNQRRKKAIWSRDFYRKIMKIYEIFQILLKEI